MNRHPEILAKSENNGSMPLFQHLFLVAQTARKIATNFNMNAELAWKGGIIHDIGKSNPVFQESLSRPFSPDWKPFRHEIASILFLPLFSIDDWPGLTEMIIAHHKSVSNDGRELGLIDLENRFEENVVFEDHSINFLEWSLPALEILEYLGVEIRPITIEEAKDAYNWAYSYCRKLRNGWSRWRGLLMAADHFASALGENTEKKLPSIFQIPDLLFYQRKMWLYPLSEIDSDSAFRHTIVTAPTGAGKTDFLLRRCRRRVFYTLPFQASINAMYERFISDLKNTNADIRLLHASSEIILKGKSKEERALQGLIGSSIKVLTPHQLAGVAFGIRGYEALLSDLEGNDVILDEIHTYTEISQAIVLKLIEILKSINCRIHVGTATMPSLLYQAVLERLGSDDVYEVRLEDKILESFNRHIIYKIDNWEAAIGKIENALARQQKLLLVANRVKKAQELFQNIKRLFPDVPKMLIHSRFKRADRAELEKKLKCEFDQKEGPCIVVSTQVVEVSLDISFDMMITDAAPLDSLIQRFGRVNRRRTAQTIGQYKSIYVVAPPESKKDALPYDLDIITKSFQALPDGCLLEEKNIPDSLNQVYTEIKIDTIETQTVFKNQQWILKQLRHQSKSALLELLDIDSAVCILESDQESYLRAGADERINLEIAVNFASIAYRNRRQLETGHRPFVVPDSIYSKETGLLIHQLSDTKDNMDNFI